MGKCPHCNRTVESKFEFLGQTSGDTSMDAKFQIVCPNCDSILGGALLTKEESGGLL